MSTEGFSQQKFVAVPGHGWLSWTRSPLAWMEQALAAWPSASVARVPRGFRRQEAARGSQSLPTQLHNAQCLQCLHQPSLWLIARCFPAPHHLPPDGWPDHSASSSIPPLPPHGPPLRPLCPLPRTQLGEQESSQDLQLGTAPSSSPTHAGPASPLPPFPPALPAEPVAPSHPSPSTGRSWAHTPKSWLKNSALSAAVSTELLVFHLCIHPCICAPLHPSTHTSMHASVHTHIHPTIHPCTNASLHPCTHPSTHPSM